MLRQKTQNVHSLGSRGPTLGNAALICNIIIDLYTYLDYTCVTWIDTETQRILHVLKYNLAYNANN